MFRYPSPGTSSGNSLATEGSTPNKSRKVLPYSTLFSRRMTNAPGSFGFRYLTFGIHSSNFRRSSSVGCFGASSGGMEWSFTLTSVACQSLRNSPPPGRPNTPENDTSPFFRLSPWHSVQYFFRNGETSSRNVLRMAARCSGVAASSSAAMTVDACPKLSPIMAATRKQLDEMWLENVTTYFAVGEWFMAGRALQLYSAGRIFPR